MTAAESPPPVVDADALAGVLARADHCHGIVTEDGIQDACGKPPVTVIDGRDGEDQCYWPACAYHAHRYSRGRCVPLADLLAATPGEGAWCGQCAGHYDEPHTCTYPDRCSCRKDHEPPGEGAALSDGCAPGCTIKDGHYAPSQCDADDVWMTPARLAARATAADPLRQAVEALLSKWTLIDYPDEATARLMRSDLRRVLDGNGDGARG